MALGRGAPPPPPAPEPHKPTIPPDVSVTDDANGPALDRQHVELLPGPRGLLAAQARHVFREIEHREQGKFPQRGAEDAGPIGQRHGARDQLGEKEVVESSIARMYPCQLRGGLEDFA
jgi:hypothetical protein